MLGTNRTEKEFQVSLFSTFFHFSHFTLWSRTSMSPQFKGGAGVGFNSRGQAVPA